MAPEDGEHRVRATARGTCNASSRARGSSGAGLGSGRRWERPCRSQRPAMQGSGRVTWGAAAGIQKANSCGASLVSSS